MSPLFRCWQFSFRDSSRSLNCANSCGRYPQTLINVRVRERQDLQTVEPVSHVIRQVSDKLGETGRLLVRYSGTEPLLRIMVEGEDESLVRTYGEEVAEVVRTHLGAGEAA